MDAHFEATYHAREDTHWWFRGRRALLLQWLRTIPTEAHILEMGCSGGPFLAELARRGYTQLTGIDISEAAIARASARGLANVCVMDASAPTLPAGTYDLIVASDVLEHLADDTAALRHWLTLLKPGGKLWVLVPAYTWLWSQHDEANHHYRRYTVKQLRQKGTEAGFAVQRTGYWNCLLLPPIAAARLLGNLAGNASKSDDLQQPAPLLNRVLLQVVLAENWLQQTLRFPAGVSAFVCLQRP